VLRKHTEADFCSQPLSGLFVPEWHFGTEACWVQSPPLPYWFAPGGSFEIEVLLGCGTCQCWLVASRYFERMFGKRCSLEFLGSLTSSLRYETGL